MSNILYRLQKRDIFSFKKERTLIYKTFFSITFQQVKIQWNFKWNSKWSFKPRNRQTHQWIKSSFWEHMVNVTSLRLRMWSFQLNLASKGDPVSAAHMGRQLMTVRGRAGLASVVVTTGVPGDAGISTDSWVSSRAPFWELRGAPGTNRLDVPYFEHKC